MKNQSSETKLRLFWTDSYVEQTSLTRAMLKLLFGIDKFIWKLKGSKPSISYRVTYVAVEPDLTRAAKLFRRRMSGCDHTRPICRICGWEAE